MFSGFPSRQDISKNAPIKLENNFDLDGVIKSLSAKVRPKNQGRWQSVEVQVRQIALLIAASAARQGFTDSAAIERTIWVLAQEPIDENDKRQIVLNQFDRINPPPGYHARMHLTIQALQSSAADQLIKYFIYEKEIEKLKIMRQIVTLTLENNFGMKYIFDWLSISQLLMDSTNIHMYFDKFESELQQHAGKLSMEAEMPIREDGKFILPYSDKLPAKRYRVMSGYMCEWAKENGFTHLAKAINSLKQDEFMGVLKLRALFKDRANSVGDTHGVWSHALQWFCIIEHYKHCKKVKLNFLGHPPLEVYQHLGDDSLKSNLHNTMWDLIFDEVAGDNYTHPNYLTKKLCEEESIKRWPLLAESIKRMRMQIKQGNWCDGDRKGFVLKKL